MPMSPRSKKILIGVLVALLWIGLSAKIPVIWIFVNIGIVVLSSWILGSSKLRQTLWGAFKRQPPANPPVGYGVTVLIVALVSILASMTQLRERSQNADVLEQQKIAKANWEKKKNEEWERQQAEKRDKFDKSISRARELAKNPERVGESVSAFTEADKIGDLTKEDSATFSELLRSIGERKLKENKAKEAVLDLEKAKDLNPGLVGVDKLLAKAKRIERKEDVKEWINQALSVARDKRLCDTPKEIAEAWDNLQKVTRKDGLYSKAKIATNKLERCRKKVIRTLVKGGMSIMRNQRIEMANKLEVSFLDQGMDARVVAYGKNKERLKMTFVLFNRAWAHKMTNGGSMSEGSFLSNLQKVGFKRVTFSDGYDSSFFYDLDPENEAKAFSRTLDGMGLGDPLRL